MKNIHAQSEGELQYLLTVYEELPPDLRATAQGFLSIGYTLKEALDRANASFNNPKYSPEDNKIV